MISCSDAVRRLWDYLDETVGEQDRQAIDEHLSLCKRCCGEMEFAQELRGFLTRHGDEGLSEPVRTKLTTFLEEL